MNAISYLTEVDSRKAEKKACPAVQTAYLRLLSVVLECPMAELAARLESTESVKSPAAA